MAEEEEQAAHGSAFPPPPYFYKDFTPPNLTRINDLRKEYLDATGVEPPDRLPEVPEDLITLQPPEEPADGQWRIFGATYTLKDELPTLEAQNITRLIPEAPQPPSTDGPAVPESERTWGDRALELKRLAKSLLLNFLELTGIMGVRPDQAAEKIDDVRTLLVNMEHGINEYRPHQAREQLIAMMQAKLDRTRAETAALRATTDNTRRVIEGLSSIEVADLDDLLGKSSDAQDGAEEREALARQRDLAAWRALESAV